MATSGRWWRWAPGWPGSDTMCVSRREERFTSLVTSAGLEMQVLAGDVQTITDLSAEQVVQGKAEMARGRARAAGGDGRSWASQGMAAIEGADLLIAVAGATPLAAALVEKTGIPMVVVHPHPGGLIRQVPMARTPVLNELMMGIHPFTWWWPFAKAINTHVRPELGLPKSPWYGPGLRHPPPSGAQAVRVQPHAGARARHGARFRQGHRLLDAGHQEIWQPPAESGRLPRRRTCAGLHRFRQHARPASGPHRRAHR